MMRKLLPLLLALCGSASASAQGFIIHFDTLQNGRAGIGRSVREVSTGFVVFCQQYTQDPSPPRQHIFVRNIGPDGTFIQEVEHGDHPTGHHDIGYIDPTTKDEDGRHVAWYREGWSYGDSAYLCRFDDAGNMVDKHFLYAHPPADSVTAAIKQVRRTSDGGFIMGGFISRPGTSTRAFLVRTANTGDTLWTATYGNSLGFNYCMGVSDLPDGGGLVAGYSTGGLDRDFLIRTDADGQELWRRNFGQFAGGNTAVRIAPDGGILTWSKYNDEFGPGISNSIGKMMLTKWSTTGNILWQTIHNRSNSTFTRDLEVLPDGTIITTGEMGMHAQLGKYSANGDSLWTRRYHLLSSKNLLYDVEPTSDGGFIATGVAERYAPLDTGFVTNQVIWVLKTDSLGCVEPGCHTVGVEEYLMDLQEHLRVWPNPVGPGQPITLSFTPPPEFVPDGALRVVVLDVAGRQVHAERIPPHATHFALRTPHLAFGRYHLHLTDDTRWLAGAGVVVE